MGAAVAVPYGTPAQGQFFVATSPTTAEWGYSAWDASTVTVTAGPQSGTTPPAPVLASGSTIMRGSATCGTGSGSATGSLATVTFGSTLPSIPVVVMTPTTSATAALSPCVTIASISATGFSVTATSPTASQANTVYGFAWQVSL